MTLSSDASVHNAYRAARHVHHEWLLPFFIRSGLWHPMAGSVLLAHLARRSSVVTLTHTHSEAIPHSSAHPCWCSAATRPLPTTHSGTRRRHTETVTFTFSDNATRGREAAVDGIRGRRGRAAEGVLVNTQRPRGVAHGDTGARGR